MQIGQHVLGGYGQTIGQDLHVVDQDTVRVERLTFSIEENLVYCIEEAVWKYSIRNLPLEESNVSCSSHQKPNSAGNTNPEPADEKNMR